MSKDEQTVKVIKDALSRLRVELADYTKNTQNKIAALELTYETLTGDKATNGTKTRVQPAPRRQGRRSKIDRKSAEKTYEFLQSRGEKPTTVAMVARRFNITPEAASQRVLKLYATGKAARVETGKYVDAAIIAKNGAGSARQAPAAGSPEPA